MNNLKHILLFTLVLSLLACNKDSDPEPPKPCAQTVIVYFYNPVHTSVAQDVRGYVKSPCGVYTKSYFFFCHSKKTQYLCSLKNLKIIIENYGNTHSIPNFKK